MKRDDIRSGIKAYMGGKLLIGRRPVRNWTQLGSYNSFFLCFTVVATMPLAINDTDDNGVRLFLCKNTFVFRKIQQKLLPPELHFLTLICTRSFVGLQRCPTP